MGFWFPCNCLKRLYKTWRRIFPLTELKEVQLAFVTSTACLVFYTLKRKGQFLWHSVLESKETVQRCKAELCDRHKQVKVTLVSAELCLKNKQIIVAVGKLFFFVVVFETKSINMTILKVKTYYYCSKPHHTDKKWGMSVRWKVWFQYFPQR